MLESTNPFITQSLLTANTFKAAHIQPNLLQQLPTIRRRYTGEVDIAAVCADAITFVNGDSMDQIILQIIETADQCPVIAVG